MSRGATKERSRHVGTLLNSLFKFIVICVHRIRGDPPTIRDPETYPPAVVEQYFRQNPMSITIMEHNSDISHSPNSF